VWEELQAEVDQLPKARPQEGILHRGRGKDHHRCAQDLGQQVQKPNYISLKIYSFKSTQHLLFLIHSNIKKRSLIHV
jgi:hypothetical protein